MKFTYDDRFLITVSKDACITIWRVQDKDGKGKYNENFSFAQEVLITKSELEDKVTLVIVYDLIIFAIHLLVNCLNLVVLVLN